MPEKKENYFSSEEKKETPSISFEKISLPEIETLDNILEQAQEVTKSALSEKEIDEMIENRQKTLERLENIELIREQRLRKVENFNPLKNLTSKDYERLVQEQIIDPEYAQRVKKLDEIIAKLESLEYPTAQVIAELEKLSQIRNSIREKLESQIEQKKQELSERKEKIKNKILEHYARRTEKLKKIIKEIEKNHKIIEKLRIKAEREKKEFEEKIEQERKELLEQISRYVQSLTTRHENVFKRLAEITNEENIHKKLLKILKEEDLPKQESIFNEVQHQIITSIIEGEKEQQLKEPKEIIPWIQQPSAISYFEAINALESYETLETLQKETEKGNEKAKGLLEQISQILAENKILRRLIGKKWITDKVTGKKILGNVWAAFAIREKNDKEGITEARKKQREQIAKREKEFWEKAQKIIDRGGFVVEVPIFKKIKGGEPQVIGKEKGVVRLEKKISKRGNEYWKVVELFGTTGNLKIGSTSPLNMSAFPQWLRESAKSHFIIQEGNFIEQIKFQEKK